MSETIRVLLADDDVIVREGLADLLNQQDGIDVVAVAENGSEALRELSKQTVDVALLDVDMPVLDGLATAKEMARLRPSVAVVMLAVFEHEESLARSLALNVRGFLTKDIPSAQLAQLIRQAHDGYLVFGPRPTRILANSYLSFGKNDPGYDGFRERVEQLPNYLRTTFDLLSRRCRTRQLPEGWVLVKPPCAPIFPRFSPRLDTPTAASSPSPP